MGRALRLAKARGPSIGFALKASRGWVSSCSAPPMGLVGGLEEDLMPRIQRLNLLSPGT